MALYLFGLKFPGLNSRLSAPRRRGGRLRAKVLSAGGKENNKQKFSSLIGITLFLSFSLFAEEPMPHSPTEDRPESETQTIPSPSKETTNTHHLAPIFIAILQEISKGKWTENRAPGPVFNTCSGWDGAVKCYWAVFRMDNLTGRYKKAAHIVYNHLTAEGLEKELRYLKSSPDSIDPYSKSWFLLMAVELIFWAAKENLPDSSKIQSMAHTLATELHTFIEIQLHQSLQGMDGGGFAFIFYALYSYTSTVNFLTKGHYSQPLQLLEDSIKNRFFHRNDNSPMDQSVRKRCSNMKRAGIHREYLEKKGLLLPGYEEFEERTAREDRKRIEDCEKEHETITFSGGKSGEPKNAASSFHYANALILLQKIGGYEAVRYFIRHNPVFPGEFALPKELENINPTLVILLVWSRAAAITILKEIYNDPEWRMTFETIKNNLEKLRIPFYDFESMFYAVFLASEPAFFNRKFVDTKDEARNVPH